MKNDESKLFGLCPLHHQPCGGDLGRREFLKGVGVASAAAGAAWGAFGQVAAAAEEASPKVRTEKKPARVKVGYLRSAGAWGGAWPGHGYNFNVACKQYSEKLEEMGNELGVQIDLSDSKITDDAGVGRFINAVKAQKPDAQLICPIGLGQWRRARKIIDSTGIPTLVFSPIGASFTMHTTPLASKPGVYLVTSLGMNDMRPGLEMVKTEKTLKQSTLLVISRDGGPREVIYGNVGTKLKYITPKAYVDAYQKAKITDDVRRLADEAAKQAKEIREIDKEDILHGAKHYFVAKQLMAAEGADGITSNCLGLTNVVGTPCLGFSRLMDEGIPAGCEADIGSAMTMFLIHNLLGRPGFMADPLVDTAKNLFANAHCNCPTKLDGFGGRREPYVLRHHHGRGKSRVSVQVLWRIGQVFTLSRFQEPNLLIVDRAKVVCNYESPPSAACITNVGSIVEGAEDNPHKVGGFHVLQIYGDHVRKLRAYCQLYGIEAVHSWDPKVSFGFQPNYDPNLERQINLFG